MKENLYKISDFKDIKAFLMSITSADNHWMYLSSTGCLSAGRQKAGPSIEDRNMSLQNYQKFITTQENM